MQQPVDKLQTLGTLVCSLSTAVMDNTGRYRVVLFVADNQEREIETIFTNHGDNLSDDILNIIAAHINQVAAIYNKRPGDILDQLKAIMAQQPKESHKAVADELLKPLSVQEAQVIVNRGPEAYIEELPGLDSGPNIPCKVEQPIIEVEAETKSKPITFTLDVREEKLPIDNEQPRTEVIRNGITDTIAYTENKGVVVEKDDRKYPIDISRFITQAHNMRDTDHGACRCCERDFKDNEYFFIDPLSSYTPEICSECLIGIVAAIETRNKEQQVNMTKSLSSD